MTEQNNCNNTLTLPLLPLKDIVVFPNMIVPVFVNEDLCVNAVEQALEGDRKIFLSAFKSIGHDGEGLEASLEPPFDVYDIGTVCSIMRTRKLPDGRMKVLVQGLNKAEVQSLSQAEPYPVVQVTEVLDPKMMNVSSEVEALIRSVRESLEKVVSLGKSLSPDILMILEDVQEPGRLADLVASNLGLKVHEAQEVLAVADPAERLKHVYTCLSREIEVYQMQVRIQSHAKDEIGRMQREHYLREQIKAIKTELGDNDSGDELEQYRKKLSELNLPEEAEKEFTRQIKRLEKMHQDSSEANIIRNFIETALALPWNTYTDDKLELSNSKEILDEEHYGLDDIKDRILEYLAVKKLNKDAKSPIICFVGPPGVGKTSLGKSIAKSLGRNFVRIALGGVRDEADIRGHRRTYVGAMPGRIVTAIKNAGSLNPVIMLDELDKLGSDHRGDPSSALLEVLDPEQNSGFVDHYLGVPMDLSKVMFIANANTLSTIPAPLRDRLELIEVSGYTEEEKLAIANQYLIPKQIKEAGLGDVDVDFLKGSVSTIINGYTRESGLRKLEQQIASVCRKVARKYAELDEKGQTNTKFDLTSEAIVDHLGAEKYGDNFYHKEATVGVSLGLAYTQFGGEVLAIESTLVPTGNFKLVLTGKLGDVMKESAQAALSYVRSTASQFGFDPAILEKNELHIHFPAGAVPKDGPSAGVAIASAILSALLDKPPVEKIAMTGEITIHGKVLPIGGVREKLLAAQREGMNLVLLPENNKAQYDELPDSLKENLEVKFVSEYFEAFSSLFPQEAGLGSSVGNFTETAGVAS